MTRILSIARAGASNSTDVFTQVRRETGKE